MDIKNFICFIILPIKEIWKRNLKTYIKLDEITSQTRKSTYILYILVMILCIYSLTKTARKNSVAPQ